MGLNVEHLLRTAATLEQAILALGKTQATDEIISKNCRKYLMPQRELNTLQLAPEHLQLVQALLHEHVPEAQVWAYGSRLTGGAHEGSDLDIVLRNPADLQHELANWFELKEALQESHLPMLVDLHLWSHLPKTFHANIEAAYVELQAGDGKMETMLKPLTA